ncbi:GvpL/GvpF family gas vesicle protein [Kitasatospora phosalacinea]|uniref:Gas vesicle protein n=1 Tax=Kitasatospora phosalacinea TaxID=2065 RepID=A0A9W6PIF7_9ACTN|nr:GvpL/GvpF family gas vesicle protein [Kitasatospora phosalacinea]GLW55493.1 gas vesicle protein [Kitasatospora phosalacinea]
MTYTWLYAVARAGPDPLPPDVPDGVADEGPRTVTADGLLAVVGSVPAPDFEADALQRHLGEPQWLERTARAHHRVVTAVGSRALPVRYGTVYRDDDRVRALLTAHADGFRTALAGITDRTEWGVKAYQERTDPDAAAEGDGPPDDRPGTAYLLRRRSARDRADHALTDAAERARQVHRALAGLADRSTEHPPQPPEATGVREPMLLNGAYLVHRSRAAEFAREVTGLQRLHGPALRVELTGPWPPYSFADLPTGEAGAAGAAGAAGPTGGDAE